MNNSKAFLFIVSILNGEQVQALVEEDAEEFISLVKHNRLCNLLLHLRADLQDVLLEETFLLLKKMSKRSHIHNFKKATLLKELIVLLREHQIPFVVLKGIPLSIQLYQHFSVKQSSDIDILIDIADYKKVHTLMGDAGFTSKYRFNALNVLNYNDFVYKKNGLYVELHSRFFNNRWLFPFKKEYITDTSLVSLGTEAVPVLRNSVYYLYLIVHSKKHNYQRIAWTYDALKFKGIMSEQDMDEARCLAESVGLKRIFEEYERLKIQDLQHLYRPVPHRGLERYRFLMGLNSKSYYKWEECLHRLLVPYRFIYAWLNK